MEENKVYYVVGVIKKEITVEVLEQTTQLKLEWADNMIGAMPVFDNIDDAEKYGEGICPIIAVSPKNNKEE